MLKIIEAVREQIEMDDPAELQKYLGVHHAKEVVQSSGHELTTYAFIMRGYFNAIGERFMKETGLKLTNVSTPNAPDLPVEDFILLHEKPGNLEKFALSFIMAYMYGSRMALPTISVVIQRLATLVTKWSAEADRRLHRLACYVHHHLDDCLTGCLSTADEFNLELVAWPDADLNGDVLTTKSTSGEWLEISGGDGRGMPVAWGARRQTATSLHTQEAETVSVASILKSEAIPAQNLMQQILGRPIPIKVMEDNEACIVALKKGYSPTMRHIARTQRISVGFVYDCFTLPNLEDGGISIHKVATAEHKGDMFTKFLGAADFEKACKMIRMTKRIKN
jgi:hypothetical protein